MLSEFEADTAEFILQKFGLLLVMLKQNRHGWSVLGQFRAQTPNAAWQKYHKIVIDTRIRLPGALIGAELIKAKEGYIMIVEIY